MMLSKEELAALVLDNLVRIAGGSCTITEEMILGSEDPLAQKVLAGLLVLHEDLTHQIQRREEVTAELRRANARLDDHVKTQQQAIAALSSPVIRIWDDILVLPLIGTVDTRRALQISENLLDAIARGSAAMVIIDVTGVPFIDKAVARNLLDAVNACRLLGSNVILTGIRPETARTIAALGIDFSALETRGNLQQGLRVAFQRTHRKVTATRPASGSQQQ